MHYSHQLQGIKALVYIKHDESIDYYLIIKYNAHF